MHSHEYLDDIFNVLWDQQNPVVIRGGFCDLVFRLVFFHQSLIGVEQWPPMVCTTVTERLKFCDEHFLRLALVLMRNDSASYTFLKYQESRPRNDVLFAESSKKMIHEQRMAQSVKVLSLTQVSEIRVLLTFLAFASNLIKETDVRELMNRKRGS